jgi:ketosteroid isomerase-like protein
VDRSGLENWIAAYERAWRTEGVEILAEVFAPDATYLASPFEEPVRGLPAIGEFWEADRAWPDEVFDLQAEIVAVEGDTGVARIEVRYSAPLERHYRDLWIVTLGDDGLCTRFEEWPFWPEHGRVAPEP